MQNAQYNHVLLQIYTKTLANKNSYLIANTFYAEDVINTSEVTTQFTKMPACNPQIFVL